MTYYIESLGCAKNLVDSERFVAIMQSYRMKEAWDITEADVVVVNSCAFLQRSLDEFDRVLNDLLKYTSNTSAKVIATGCVTTRALAEYQDLFPEVDAWIMLKDFAGFEKYLRSNVLPKGTKQGKLAEAGRFKFQDGQHV